MPRCLQWVINEIQVGLVIPKTIHQAVYMQQSSSVSMHDAMTSGFKRMASAQPCNCRFVGHSGVSDTDIIQAKRFSLLKQ